MTTNDFLPEGYEIPTNPGNYVKLAQGKTKLRILEKPVVGWLDRTEEVVDGKSRRKPLRYHMDKKPIKVFSKDGLKAFWAMPVWNYEVNTVQIWEITQKSLMNMLVELKQSEDFKDIYGYDITISKVGEKMETRYTLLPGKEAPLSDEIKNVCMDKFPKMGNLFTGEDPFAD